jgi:hypothetical protein
MVINELGDPRSEKDVMLLQDDHAIPSQDYCTWMPYQKGQAAKTEELETRLAKG